MHPYGLKKRAVFPWEKCQISSSKSVPDILEKRAQKRTVRTCTFFLKLGSAINAAVPFWKCVPAINASHTFLGFCAAVMVAPWYSSQLRITPSPVWKSCPSSPSAFSCKKICASHTSLQAPLLEIEPSPSCSLECVPKNEISCTLFTPLGLFSWLFTFNGWD